MQIDFLSNNKSDNKTMTARGEVRVDLGPGVSGNIHASQEAPLEKVLGIATDIWAAVKRSGVEADDNEGNDRLLKELQQKHQEFATSYPIPFRWMVQAREYEPRAFEKFLREHVKVMYKDRKEFLAAQGEYLVILYRTRNPRAGTRQIGRYREAIRKALEKDDETFTKAREQAEEEVRRLDEEVDEDRRKRMFAYLERLKAEKAAMKEAYADKDE